MSDPVAWAQTIANAPVVLSYDTNVRLSKLLPSSMADTAAALDAVSCWNHFCAIPSCCRMSPF